MMLSYYHLASFRIQSSFDKKHSSYSYWLYLNLLFYTHLRINWWYFQRSVLEYSLLHFLDSCFILSYIFQIFILCSGLLASLFYVKFLTSVYEISNFQKCNYSHINKEDVMQNKIYLVVFVISVQKFSNRHEQKQHYN